MRVGLWLSVTLMAAGATLRATKGQPATAFSLAALSNPPDLAFVLTSLGILVLAVTPVLRVASLATMFFAQRDWRFFRLTLLVLVLLGVGVVLGKGG